MDDTHKVTLERLRELEPLSNLSTERLEELVTLSTLDRLPIGLSVFREGDIDNQTIYLLEGEVSLTSSDGKIDKTVSSKDKISQYPLDDSQPHQLSCVALSRVEILRIDNNVLDYMMMWDQMAVSEEAQVEETVVEEQLALVGSKNERPDKSAAARSGAEEDRSWIRKMRHIMAFKNMPPANIKSLLERMETMLVQQGDVIVNQGEPGDYYYVLTEGTARVTRTIELAELEPGTSFGEEALVSGSVRNATVTMSSDGMLMRLSKQNFDALLKDPLLVRVSPDEARERVSKGSVWLDVRHAKEYHHNHLPDAINIPLHELRLRIGELDKNKHYICYCGTGRRSSAAAFLLVQNSIAASVLSGGLQVMSQDAQK